MGSDPHSNLTHHDSHAPVSSPPTESNPPMQLEIDYTHFDERFDNRPVRIGPEWSDIDEEREQYIRENALNWQPGYDIPDAIPGLQAIARRKTPATRLWYRRVSSFERNGFFNVWTIKFNVKIRYLLFYPCLMWGMTSHVNTGWYAEVYDHSDDRDLRVYDKLAVRPLPFNRVFGRPG